jgi:error-prone DNA polymerase
LSALRPRPGREAAAGAFAHLHVASSYSLRYGTATPAALVTRAAALGMSALALTDRDGLYGAFKHAVACDAAGVAPILGADLALAAGGRITVLAGRGAWASLCRLVSAAHAHGGRGNPAVTPDLVAAHSAGLIVLLGPDSDVGRAVAAGRPAQARAVLNGWRDRCEAVIEIVDHRAPGDTRRAGRMLGLAREAGLTAVLSNAVRYLDPADSPLAQVLDAARQRAPLGSPRLAPEDQRPATANGQAHLASGAQMEITAARVTGGAGRDADRLLADTAALARRCYLDPGRDLGIGARHLPEPGLPGTSLLTTGLSAISRPEPGLSAVGDPLAQLRHACEQALPGYRGSRHAARERLEHELAIIARTHLASYFLTVADVARRIRQRGIRCAIRGSGAGCLVNHLTGISAVDPLEHGLIMERFLSQGRATLPDIDLDVESARRIEAYRVILDAYGEQRCACVCMIATYRARSAIRDVGAALSLPPDETARIAAAFPHIRAAHIGRALTELPELRGSRLSIPQLATTFRLAERLDGLPRHVALHPCGVLLSDASLLDRTAVERSTDDLPLSQLDKDDAETAGVIKLDVLGVRMQSAMAHAVAEVGRATGERVDLDAIPRDDEPTFAMIRAARTVGVFQIESPGQRELVARVAPRGIGDLIAEISLFRPGPVNSDMITPFLDVRHGIRVPCYPHQDLKDALGETGGVVVFHEQVLRIIDVMTGCGLGQAELVRRKLAADVEETGRWFRSRARGRGYDPVAVDRVWEVLAAFGAFGFCKAHAAAFAVPVYQSAWLKRHHPAAFYAGVLSHDPGMYPKRVIVQDARLSGVAVRPVDVNASGADWTVTPDPTPGLRVALREIKGISDAELAKITAAQPYASLRDFTERARVSRPVTERLVLVGAFDSLYANQGRPPGAPRPTRRDLLARVGILDHSPAADPLPLDLADDGFAGLVPAGELRELDHAERVAAELEILGFDVSGHVLGFFDRLLDDLDVVRSTALHRHRPGSMILVAGVKVATQTPAVRSGQRIIFATLDDEAGLVDLAFFDRAQQRCADKLFGSWLLLVRGRLRHAGPAGAGPGAYTVNAEDCWDLRDLEHIRATRGPAAVRAALRPASPPPSTTDPARPTVFPNGFTLSPYAETGSPGARPTYPSRHLWHPSP